ncbi:hypothetical protein Ecaj_0745 [Ehrlichia canis str. Jake]|uniref:Uncharacterized protein n=1 Tax=Ehrlichia canis (strain Jake) TaxID=269484 RepID=A0ACA6AWN2_EHRCJ|nr:hypothetical protein Ecaj_0745 [Ehrlichia canis str. Jake]
MCVLSVSVWFLAFIFNIDVHFKESSSIQLLVKKKYIVVKYIALLNIANINTSSMTALTGLQCECWICGMLFISIFIIYSMAVIFFAHGKFVYFSIVFV